MTVGENIKRIRKEKGITQKELGERLGGISQQQIGQWENGDKNPKFETIIKLASALGCSVRELESKHLQVDVNISSGGMPIIINGVISPQITDISKALNDFESNTPFTALTSEEKLIVYFNSLNSSGKAKAFDYLELLLSSSQYRNMDIDC